VLYRRELGTDFVNFPFWRPKAFLEVTSNPLTTAKYLVLWRMTTARPSNPRRCTNQHAMSCMKVTVELIGDLNHWSSRMTQSHRLKNHLWQRQIWVECGLISDRWSAYHRQHSSMPHMTHYAEVVTNLKAFTLSWDSRFGEWNHHKWQPIIWCTAEPGRLSFG
jgi:hypothetical protein